MSFHTCQNAFPKWYKCILSFIWPYRSMPLYVPSRPPIGQRANGFPNSFRSRYQVARVGPQWDEDEDENELRAGDKDEGDKYENIEEGADEYEDGSPQPDTDTRNFQVTNDSLTWAESEKEQRLIK
ncbi:hypothetical protein BDV10DRAFT_184475 [Aspergillus recurvatus]